MFDIEIEEKFAKIVKRLSKDQGTTLDLQSIIFLIGVRELGSGYQNFTKDQKIELMHIAICKLLSPYGYYTLEGLDKDGWPHYIRNEKLPHLEAKEQNRLLKESIINYFESEEI